MILKKNLIKNIVVIDEIRKISRNISPSKFWIKRFRGINRIDIVYTHLHSNYFSIYATFIAYEKSARQRGCWFHASQFT